MRTQQEVGARTTREPETWKEYDQIIIDSEEEYTSGSEGGGIEDRRPRANAVMERKASETYHKKIESRSWTSSSAAQAHDTTSCEAG